MKDDQKMFLAAARALALANTIPPIQITQRVNLCPDDEDLGTQQVWARNGAAEARFVLSHILAAVREHLAESPMVTIPGKGGALEWLDKVMKEMERPHPCGHAELTQGCGGCDPGAIEYEVDEHGRIFHHYCTTLNECECT